MHEHEMAQNASHFYVLEVDHIKTQPIKTTIKQERVTDMGRNAMHQCIKWESSKRGEKSILVP